MAGKETAPFTAEGKRASDKVRAIFMAIAAANLAIVAIVTWNHYQSRSATRGGGKEAMVQIETVIEKSIATYNAEDRETFLKLFSASAVPVANGAFFDTTIRDDYRRKFGTVKVGAAVASMTANTAAGGTRVFDLQCENGGTARLFTKFIRETDTLKLVEWRIGQP